MAGGELLFSTELTLRDNWKLPVKATYTLTHSAFTTDFTSGFAQFESVSRGDALPYLPVHQGSLSVSLDTKSASLGMSSELRSGMRDSAGSGPLTDRDVPGMALLHLSGRLALSDQLTVYATVQNLLNAAPIASWRPLGARPVAPRMMRIGLKGTLK